MRQEASRRLVRLGRWLRHRHRPGVARCFAAAHRLDPANAYAAREVAKRRPRGEGLPRSLSYVALGTAGTCNASCIHCPTGKPETAHVPRGDMPMALYRRIVDGIVELGLPITDQVSFGLFGDGLVDRSVVERAAYLKARLPDVRLVVNTNGAAYGPRHAGLAAHVDVLALHCESLETATYDLLMQPLRLARTRPRYEAILRDFAGKVHVSVPVSRRNRAELPAIRRWFEDRGAVAVQFDPLHNRCTGDQRLFDSLALAPIPIACAPAVLDEHLIVDCDGLVLVCCQDFTRVEAIGDLASDSLADTLRTVRRRHVRRLFADGRHGEMRTCAGCRSDPRTPAFPFDLPD